MFKPVIIGIVTYILTAIGLWFFLSLLFVSLTEKVFFLVPFISAIIPLIVSGYVVGINLKRTSIIQLILYSGLVGLVGFSLSLLVTEARGEKSLFIILLLGAFALSALGGFVGGRKNVL